jgi:anti-anti-sigma factor
MSQNCHRSLPVPEPDRGDDETVLELVTPSGPVPRTEVLAALQGDLDEQTVGVLRNRVFPLLDPAPERLVLDVSRVTSVRGAGIRTLVALRRKCTSAGVRFVLRAPSTSMRTKLTMGHLASFFEIES